MHLLPAIINTVKYMYYFSRVFKSLRKITEEKQQKHYIYVMYVLKYNLYKNDQSICTANATFPKISSGMARPCLYTFV